jgi:hypothetical protein
MLSKPLDVLTEVEHRQHELANDHQRRTEGEAGDDWTQDQDDPINRAKDRSGEPRRRGDGSRDPQDDANSDNRKSD